MSTKRETRVQYNFQFQQIVIPTFVILTSPELSLRPLNHVYRIQFRLNSVNAT